MSPASVSIEHVRICRTCLRLYETEHPSGLRQRCACQEESATWPGFDFNEHVHLCECCRVEVLPSGSKWSPILCASCKAKAIAVNERARCALVPFARHSMTAGIGIPGRDLVDGGAGSDAAVNAFSGQVRGFAASIEEVFAFGTETLGRDLSVLDLPQNEDVDLGAHLEAAAAAARDEEELGYRGSFWGTDTRFRSLCAHLRAAAERIHGPSGPELWQPYLEHLPIEIGFVRCDVCGEYKGSSREDYGESIGVRCLCDGVICRDCGERKVHRPISEYFDEATGTIWHVPHFGPPICKDCWSRRRVQGGP